MAAGFCANCGAVRGDGAFCSSCGREFDQPAPAAPPAPPQMAHVGLRIGLLALLMVLALSAGGAYALLTRTRTVPAYANLPPAGVIWFGSSFDPTTFDIHGKTGTISATQAFSAVAHTTRSMKGSDMSIRISFNGTAVASSAVTWQGEGDIWGFSRSAVIAPGFWTYDLVDVGGNVLASGTITAT